MDLLDICNHIGVIYMICKKAFTERLQIMFASFFHGNDNQAC